MDSQPVADPSTESRHPVDAPFSAPAEAVLVGLRATPDGLSVPEAQRRAQISGPNRLSAQARKSLLRRMLKHFDDVLIYILLGAAVLKAILGDWVDFGVILAVAVISAMVGFIQEGRAEHALEGIKNMLSLDAHARRDGQWQTLPADQLVPGDVVRVSSGDKVPADLRLLDAANLRVEESALTGEAVPAEKAVTPVEADAGIGDRSSMLYSGTLVASGHGVGVVTAIGAEAEIGRIQTMLSGIEDFQTPLTREMNRFGKDLSLVILGMAAVMLVIGRLIHDFDPAELISAAIGFAVAAIPEGLPALVTITLALGVQQMAARNAIMRNLPAVETLGAVTTVCSDKTGTLTRNEMTVRSVVTARGPYEVAGLGYEPVGEITFGGFPATLESFGDLRTLITVMGVANDSHVVEDDGHWRVVGEPTEGALAALAVKAEFDPGAYTRQAVVPFESEHKYMATLNQTPSGQRVILVKGAPDRVLDRCATQLDTEGRPQRLNRASWEAEISRLGAQGLRVLAAAARPAHPDQSVLGHDDLVNLRFVGLVGIVDPPRPDAIDAIATCHRAGISVKMITGDHAGTATAIAREMGIADHGAPNAVSGPELERTTTEQLRRTVRRTDIFARTSPEHKLRLVRALQANGEVVAMTGDGVNDAPALKRANVGVAMGIKGTEATKEAADVVLADDNFSSIEKAVEEGRRIYDNLQKSILFLLPTNGAQSLVILVAVLFGLALPLDPVQILWINLVTAITLSLALAYEPAEPDLMSRPPRDPRATMLPRVYLARIAYVSVLIAGVTLGVFYVARYWEWPTDQAQTLAVTMLALGQVAYLFSARSLHQSSLRREMITGNGVVWVVVGLMIALQLVFVYAPFMHSWFGSAALPVSGWLVTAALSVALFMLIEVGKMLFRRRVPAVGEPQGALVASSGGAVVASNIHGGVVPGESAHSAGAASPDAAGDSDTPR